MNPASAIDFARTAILVLLEIIAPSMMTALVVGLGIGLLQALTQIQEQTLVFVPKIVAIFHRAADRAALRGRGDERADDRYRRAYRRLLSGKTGSYEASWHSRCLRPVFRNMLIDLSP